MECLLHTAEKKFGFYPAIITDNSAYSYRQLNRFVRSTAEKLKFLKPGSRVAICAPVSVEYIILLFTLWRKKTAVCLINTYLPPQQRKNQMRTAQCNLLLQPEKIVTLDNKNTAKDLTIIPDQAATIMFTSGSEGRPKPAVHSYANHYFSALGSSKNIPVKPGDRWLLNLPVYHVSGLSILFRTFLGGGAVVITSGRESAKAIDHFHITHISAVPAQLHRLVQGKNPSSLRSLKAVLVGGAPIPQTLIATAHKKGLPVYITYGLTEMASQVATSQKNGKKVKTLPFRELKISADGEILVRGKTLFQGYLQKGKIIRPTDKDGWFHTKDVGALENGSLKIIGRKDNMFISGGENIQPEEIEQYLGAIPGVEKAVVIPVADHVFGRRPVAFVKTRVRAKSIEQALRKQIARYQIPDRFYQWPREKKGSIKPNRSFFSRLLSQKKTRRLP